MMMDIDNVYRERIANKELACILPMSRTLPPQGKYKAIMLNKYYRLSAKCSGYAQEMYVEQTTGMRFLESQW
jgi:hypothetical protein